MPPSMTLARSVKKMARLACGLCLLAAAAGFSTCSPQEQAQPPAAGRGAPVEECRLIMYYRGVEVGFERYAIFQQPDGNRLLEVQSRFFLPKGSGNISFEYDVSEVATPAMAPLKFDEVFRVNGTESNIHLTVVDGQVSDQAFMGGHTLSRSKAVTPSVRIIEEAVYSLYYMLYKKFAMTVENVAPLDSRPSPAAKKGKKVKPKKGETTVNVTVPPLLKRTSIPVYVPKIAVELSAQVGLESESTLTTPLGEMKIRRYIVDLGTFQTTMVDVNERGQLIKIFSPKQEVELVRDFAYDMGVRVTPQPGQPQPGQPPQPGVEAPSPAPQPAPGFGQGTPSYAAQAGVASPQANRLPASVSETVVFAVAGKSFTVEMQSNHSTGFQWRMEQGPDANLLRVEGVSYKEAEANLPGGGGTETWTFHALGPGTAKFSMAYVRPWEKDVPPAKTMGYAIRILPIK